MRRRYSRIKKLLLAAATIPHRLLAWLRASREAQSPEPVGSKAVPVIGPSSWPEFEMLIAESFRRRGFTVSHSVSGGPDGGWDLVLKKQGSMSLVQCKHWRTRSVGVKAVREFHGVINLHNADGGFLVTAGTITPAAQKYAADARIELIDGPRLAAMIHEFDEETTAATADVAVDPQCLPCPQCGEPMLRRTAKRGAAGGAEFWGCSAAPHCGGTRVEWAGERRRAS